MFAVRRTLTTSALVGMAGRRGKHSLPDLSYDYGALEPVISGHIMELHHKKHHQTYVNNLNAAEEKLHEAIQKNDIAAQVALQPAIRFNGGGHINHSIFWTNLAPAKNGGGQVPTSGPLLDAIVKDFGSVDALIEKMTAASVAVQGSGWGWLGYDAASKSLRIAACPNQDPLVLNGLTPLLGIDVWEHAYYLDYKNVRADYVKNIWKIVNWQNVAERYAKAAGK